LVEDALAPTDPHAQWSRLDIAPDFDEATRRALHALYTWRETEARKRNNPAHFVLSPSIALDLARRRPTSIAGLRANRRFPQGLLKRQGAVLIRLIEAASHEPSTPPPVVHPPAGRVSMLRSLRAVLAARSNIAPNLLLPDGTIKQVETSYCPGQTACNVFC
jgi:ribonuclease D